MRVIEKKMIAAINEGKDFTLNNTHVKNVKIDANTAHVFLHGNHIASVVNGIVMVNVDTLKAYPTVTTKSRLRALGINVTTKQGITYLNGEKV
jgi:hypothetical protein